MIDPLLRSHASLRPMLFDDAHPAKLRVILPGSDSDHPDRPKSDMRAEPVPLDARFTNRQRITAMRRRIHSWLMRAGLLEAAVLVSLLMIAAAIWGFAAVADEVREGDTKAFDESVLR